MIRLTIDDREVVVPEGTMIVDAAAKLDIEVPIYCYHQALGPLGACRMCLVQVEKMPKLVTGCTTAVKEDMVVHTKGEAVEKGRRGVLEFLLINHPLDCPVCDKGGECFLQDYTFRYGPAAGRYQEAKIQRVKDEPINDFIVIDQERCVLCQRCVRFMADYVGENQMMMEGRGVETVISTVENKPVTSQYSGNVIDLCPVGALTSIPYRFKARPWNQDKYASICPHCPVGCTVQITERDGHVVRTEGRPVPEREWGWLCDRGRFGYDFAYAPGRLLRSKVHGEEQSAALATREVAKWLKETMEQDGGDAVAMIVGGTHTAEEAHQIARFARDVIGTDQLAISRSVPGYLPRGLNGTYEDIAEADRVVLLGVEPYDAVPVVHLKLRDRRLRGPLDVVGIGPRRLTRETLSGEDILVAPGEDAALVAASLGRVAPDHPAVKALAAELKDWTPEGVTGDELAALGRKLIEGEHLVLLWDGKTPAMADVLEALSQVREGATRVLPTFGPANWRGFEDAGISADFDRLTRILEGARDGSIRLLWVWGADVLREYPDTALVQAALKRVQWIQEGLFAPTGAEWADALLPGAGWAEVGGTYVNMEGRPQWGKAAAQPPGQSRPVKTYLNAVARNFGRPFSAETDWKPEPPTNEAAAPAPIREVARPPARTVAAGRVEIVGESSAMEGGLPSRILEPRKIDKPGRIGPDDARAWGIGPEGGTLELERDDRRIRVDVQVDERVPAGRVFILYGTPDNLIGQIGEGVARSVKREEVPAQ